MAPRFGVGFRSVHAVEIEQAQGLDWLEVLSDHHLGVGGPRRRQLERLRERMPLALHGVMLSIAGSDPFDRAYVERLADLARHVAPVYVSDHLCWTSLGGHQSHDLLPVALTRAVLDHVADRVDAVQERLGRRLLLENASAYVAFRGDELDETAFLAALARRTGCGVLLDVNNLVVNAANLGVDPLRALAALPPEAVGYLHVAGHARLPDVRIDTHDADVPAEVWGVFEAAVRRFPAADVILERDDAIPPLADLLVELDEARRRHAAALRAPGAAALVPVTLPPSPSARAPLDWPALQRAFFPRIVDQPLGHEQHALGGLLDTERPVAAARGLRVYSDAYAAGLRRALATNFAALATVLGASDFDRLAAGYLRAHPPRDTDAVRLGAALPEFVRGFPFASGYGVSREVLVELAALEQTQLEVQDAPDPAAPVLPDALAALPPEAWDALRVEFAAAFRLQRASHDVATVVEAVEKGAPPARPALGEVAYLVSREGGGVCTERLAPEEAALLEALVLGRSLADAALGAVRTTGRPWEAVARVAAARLLRAAAAGLLAAAAG